MPRSVFRTWGIFVIVNNMENASEKLSGPKSECLKERIAETNRWKIDIADEVFVVNVGGKIPSEISEDVLYAKTTGKKIGYLENPA